MNCYFAIYSVDPQGLLLQSRLDLLLKLVVGRPEHKTKKLWIISPVSCYMVLKLSKCSILVTNFALRPQWLCISFSRHANAAEFQFFIIYMWLVLGPYQFNDARCLLSCQCVMGRCSILSCCHRWQLSLHNRWLSNGFTK